MVQAKMPFFFLLMYPDWPLTPFIVFCSDKKYYQYNLFHFFLILIFFFGHKNLGVLFLQNDHDVKVDTTTLQVINHFCLFFPLPISWFLMLRLGVVLLRWYWAYSNTNCSKAYVAWKTSSIFSSSVWFPNVPLENLESASSNASKAL